MRTLTFFTAGTPRPQGSKIYSSTGHGREASRFLDAWRKHLKLDAMRARAARPAPFSGQRWETATGAIEVSIVFYVPDVATGKPDIDKLTRAVLDVLSTGSRNQWAGVYRDDSQVIKLNVDKIQAGSGLAPRTQCGVEVTVIAYDEV